VTEAAPVASALRVALLARPGPAADRLRATLGEIGTDLVLEADPVESDPQALADAAPQAVVVVLDPAVEDVLERYDPVLADPAVDVLYEEAELAVAREGWDAARWGRHLSAKLMHHGDVLPPGREADTAPVGDVPDLQPGRPPTPAQLAEDRPYDFDRGEASEHGFPGPGQFHVRPGGGRVRCRRTIRRRWRRSTRATGSRRANREQGDSRFGCRGRQLPLDESTDAGANDAQAGPDGGPRYERDLADLDRRIAEMSLVDDSGIEAAARVAGQASRPRSPRHLVRTRPVR
jgi:hypothetical protein